MSLSGFFLAAVTFLHLLDAANADSLAARYSGRSKILDKTDDLLPEYDFVIIGGGTAGLTVADRLTENLKCMKNTHSCYPGQVQISNTNVTQTPFLCWNGEFFVRTTNSTDLRLLSC